MDGISSGEKQGDGGWRSDKANGTALPDHERDVSDVAGDSLRTPANEASEFTSDALDEQDGESDSVGDI